MEYYPTRKIAPAGFGPVSRAPKALVLGRYTTGLRLYNKI